jgi:hypothetical protein
VTAAKLVKPLSETAKEKIKLMRDWSVGRARPASTPEAGPPRTRPDGGRTLDI